MTTTPQSHTPGSTCDFVGRQYDSCWAFICAFFASRGLEVDPDAYVNRDRFREVEHPADGDLVILSQYGFAGHCGIYENRRIYHLSPTLGVVRQRADSFPYRQYYTPAS